MRRGSHKELDELRRAYARHGEAIRLRLDEFSKVRPEEYFYELAYCLLTPQSSAVNAGKAIGMLRQADLLGTGIDPVDVLFSKSHYIRFHNTKARRLIEARSMLKEINAAITAPRSSVELRGWLVLNVKGLGWKEASHFLRNIGHRDLAILDRHILRNLRRHGVIHSLPTSLTPGRYLSIEKKFLRFAAAIGIAMDELDLLFWSRETGEILK